MFHLHLNHLEEFIRFCLNLMNGFGGIAYKDITLCLKY